MLRTVAGRVRPLSGTAAVLAAAALTSLALAAAPASADGTRPGLVLGPQSAVDGVRPGDSFELPGTFANKGSKPIAKVWLSYDFSRGLTHQELPSNCERPRREYPGAPAVPADEDGLPGESGVVCEFDQTVEAGAVYAPEKTLSLDVLAPALYEHAHVMVGNYDPREDGSADAYVPGTGPAVKLVELPPDTPVGDGHRPSSEDEYFQADRATVPVTAVNTADFQVTARQTARAGKSVTLEVGFTNAGPAWVNGDGPATSILVQMPAGTTVTRTARFCKQTGSGSYSCVPHDYYFVNENTTDTYTFTVRVDKTVPGARGSVALEAKERPFDRNKKNDTAAILLDAHADGDGSTGGTGSTDGGSTGGSGSAGGDSAGGAGSTGGSGSTSSTGGSGSTDGSGTGGSATAGSTGTPGAAATGGGLASTGSDTTLPLTAAAGAALAVGAGTVLLARRRATRR
ncbi:LPXTG cell wall anchor domain-containing protein [Streptomyces sp. NPDC051920]|uniref:LPXTG cell wall anchor domain-containing protein n=1 Tax=Streptomyces sp. NPDC051920 TaxID=3155523 RepID=UPI003426E6D4